MEPEGEHSMILSRGEFSFYRIEQTTQIQSDAPFAVGAPIVLHHAAHRRKIVLNLLVDGLAWQEMRKFSARTKPRAFVGKSSENVVQRK